MQRSETSSAQEPSTGAPSDEDHDREENLSVADGLAELQNEIDHFQKEVDVCNQERLGSIQIAVGDLGDGLRFVTEQNSGEYSAAVLHLSLPGPNRARLQQTCRQ